MTVSKATILLGLLTAIGIGAYMLAPQPEPEPACDSCTARHKDKERLRDLLKTQSE